MNQKKARHQTVQEVKGVYPNIGLDRICRLFGLSRQAHYKYLKTAEKTIVKDHIVNQMVLKVRKDHPRMGTRKIYHLIKPDLDRTNIKMGRDALFNLMAFNGLQVKKSKRKHISRQTLIILIGSIPTLYRILSL